MRIISVAYVYITEEGFDIKILTSLALHWHVKAPVIRSTSTDSNCYLFHMVQFGISINVWRRPFLHPNRGVVDVSMSFH